MAIVWLCGEGNFDMEPVLFASNLLQDQSDVINLMCQFYYSHRKFIIIYNDPNHCDITHAYYRTIFTD